LANPDVEKQSSGGFERFMFLVTPILFAIIMLIVLLAMFKSDFRNKLLEIGNSIPVLAEIVPEPKQTTVGMTDEELRNASMSDKIAELQVQLNTLQNELDQAAQKSSEQEGVITGLQSENNLLKQQNEEQVLEDEAYTAKIQELASMFAKMTPSKAGAIIQSMTPQESVLILSEISADNRAKILEKMSPKIAADISMLLKDSVSAKDAQIAALQSRLDAEQKEEAKVSTTLDQEQLTATFTSMDAKNAAELLLKMNGISQAKVIRILNLVDNNTRSSILTEMSAINNEEAAKIVSMLVTAN